MKTLKHFDDELDKGVCTNCRKYFRYGTLDNIRNSAIEDIKSLESQLEHVYGDGIERTIKIERIMAKVHYIIEKFNLTNEDLDWCENITTAVTNKSTISLKNQQELKETITSDEPIKKTDNNFKEDRLNIIQNNIKTARRCMDFQNITCDTDCLNNSCPLHYSNSVCPSESYKKCTQSYTKGDHKKEYCSHITEEELDAMEKLSICEPIENSGYTPEDEDKAKELLFNLWNKLVNQRLNQENTHQCLTCNQTHNFRGFCSKECHDEHYDEHCRVPELDEVELVMCAEFMLNLDKNAKMGWIQDKSEKVIKEVKIDE